MIATVITTPVRSLRHLAVAHPLATDELQVLILDDVLVNTDPVRQDRILDVLGAQADRLQILFLTCHTDRKQRSSNPAHQHVLSA